MSKQPSPAASERAMSTNDSKIGAAILGIRAALLICHEHQIDFDGLVEIVRNNTPELRSALSQSGGAS